MSSTRTSTSLSFKPWTRDTTTGTALKDVLARVNLERGHFRDITEASLQEEIAAEGALELSSSDDEDDDQDSEAAKDTKRKVPTTREELYAAKKDMLDHAAAAHQDVMMALDFISLLESKHAQSQATVSMSQALKSSGVPNGSLGTEVWHQKATPENVARQAQDDLLASNVRMTSLQQSADDLLAAATRLKDNVRKETMFWDEILSVSGKGWSVSKIHPKSHLFGVSFGFNGSAPEFARRNVAALIDDSDGNLSLERGIGTKPKAVRAIVRKGPRVVGISTLPSTQGQVKPTLDARIRHARDSVYDEELFHEMIGEARTLASIGVSMKGQKVAFTSDADGVLGVELELVPLDEDWSPEQDGLRESDILAQAVILTARLLLGQEHRRKIKQKEELPTPMTDKKDENEHVSFIIQPLLLLLKYHFALPKLNSYLASMSKLLRAAQVSAECHFARLTLTPTHSELLDAESLIESLRSPTASEGLLKIVVSEELTLEFKVRVTTSPANASGLSFMLQTPIGPFVEFDILEDAFIAADEFVSLALSRVLKNAVGEGWELAGREGRLSRSSGREERDSLWFSVDNVKQIITMHYRGSNGGKEIDWELGRSGENKALTEVWKGLLQSLR